MNSITTTYKPSSRTIFKFLCILSFFAAPIALLIWLPLSYHSVFQTSAFEGTPIGGNLSLNAAKAIDFASSAIFAPLIFFLLNYTWFTNAQVALGDERKRKGRGAPLSAFVEASQTSSGSYDLNKLRRLLGSKSGQMSGMAVMALFAAVAQSALSNIIAYEAFVEAGGGKQDVRLRMLVDSTLNTAVFNPSIGGVEIPGFNNPVDFDLTDFFIDFITADSRTDNLTAGVCLAPNVTLTQLSNVNISAQQLQNVPATRGTIDCQAYIPKSIVLAVSNAYTINELFIDDESPEDTAESGYTGPGYLAEWPASASLDALSTKDYIDYMAYNKDSTEVFFGVLGTNSSMGSSTRSPFGTITATQYNTTLIGMSNDSQLPRDYTAYTWGMKCRISEGAATLTLNRQNSTSTYWVQSDPQVDASNGTVHSSFLSAFAVTDYELTAPL